jgi:hypothetical protein
MKMRGAARNCPARPKPQPRLQQASTSGNVKIAFNWHHLLSFEIKARAIVGVAFVEIIVEDAFEPTHCKASY